MSTRLKHLHYPLWMMTLRYFLDNPDCIATNLVMSSDISPGHFTTLSKILASKDLIIRKKVGRTNIINLTDKGKALALNIKDIQEILED